MAAETPEVFDFLLNCQICLEPFDQKLRIPRILPCHHTFCSPCIARLVKGGNLTCPNDRSEIRVSGSFPVDFTRAAVVEHKDVLHQKGGASSPLEEACQKHRDEKLKFYCSTCKSALCSECAIVEHGNKTGHKIVKLGDVLEQVKRQLKARSKELQHIQESSLHPRAKMATTSLQETDTSFKAAEQEIEVIFSKAVNALLDRKAQAVEELRGKWKENRLEMEDQAAVTESLNSSAKTSTALGMTVISVGLPSHIVAQEQELERAVQEARAEGEKPLLTSLSYEVTADLSDFMKSLPALGTVESVRSQSREQKSGKQQQKERKQVTSQSSGVPTTASMTSSTILTPAFQLEPGWCKVGCTLGADGRMLTNKPRPQSGGTGQSGSRPFAFLGARGSVDLTQPALHYWTVTCAAWLPCSGARCEFGLASLQTLDTCGEEQRISDHDEDSATLVMVRDGETWRLEGRNWSTDVDTPPPPQDRDVIYTCLWQEKIGYNLSMTLGFLYDNRQPQSPRVLVVEKRSCRLLGVRRLSPCPDLRPVLRVWPTGHAQLIDASLEVETGPAILSDVTAGKLQSLLRQMDR